MISFTKKFTVTTPMTDILSMFSDDFNLAFGEFFKRKLDNHENIPIGADIIVETGNPQFQIRHTYGVTNVSQDLIGGSVLSFGVGTSVAEIICESICSGTITFKVE